VTASGFICPRPPTVNPTPTAARPISSLAFLLFAEGAKNLARVPALARARPV
jgi:hypothetical protein